MSYSDSSQPPSSVSPRSNPFASYEKPRNPFLVDATVAPEPVRERRHEWGSYSLPETVDDEVLPSNQEDRALEILVTWGSSVLHVVHLSPPRTFTVGSGLSGEAVDFVVSEEMLLRESLPLVLVDGSQVRAVVPPGATGELKLDKITSRLEDGDHLLACLEVTGARAIQLGEKMRLTMRFGELVFNVRLLEKSAPMERGLAASWDWTVPSYFGATAVAIGALMGTLGFFVPPLGLEDEAELDKKRMVLISQYLDAASEREQRREELPEPETGAAEGGEMGKQAEGREGEAGKEDAPRVNKRVSVAGPRDNPQLELSRHEALQEARDFGMIGILSSGIASDPLAPTSILGGDHLLGNGDLTANGAMWGDEIGESGGRGGLGLLGDGFGGGSLYGKGIGIGIGDVGTIGIGQGKGEFGLGRGISGKGHAARAPRIRPEPITSLSGRLPAEVIQRVVRQNFGRFRMCYQEALGRNPSLEGRIPVRFVIGRDGGVSNVSAGGDVPDTQVRSCVQAAFYGLSFPPPEDGIVTVTYPLLFSPE